MNELDQRLLEAVRLITDAHRAGQLAALRATRERLAERSQQLKAVILTTAHPGGKVKARGAHEAIEHILRELDEEIAAVEDARDE